MADRVEPSAKGVKNYATTKTFQFAGLVDGWVAPSNTAYVADVDGGVTGAPLNAFGESHSSTSFTVTIDTGEGFLEGRWCARDVTTDVTLASSTTGQVVYAGWQNLSADTMIIGLDADFGADDGQVPIWEFDTDGNGVTAARRQNIIGPAIEEVGGDLVINTLLELTSDVTVQTGASITSTNTGIDDAPLIINDRSAFSELNGWAVMYNRGGSGWRLRDPTGIGDAFYVEPDGDAVFPAGSQQLALENRTTDPSSPRTGRMWYRTDLEQ